MLFTIYLVLPPMSVKNNKQNKQNRLAAKEDARWQHFARNLAKLI
jgi:hypothetical protein